MKYSYLIAVALLGGGVTAGQAQTTSTGNVSINGQVAGLCILGPPSQATVPLGQLINTSGPRVGRIAAIPSQQITLPGSFCNFAGTALTVTANALLATDDSPIQTGFARAVNFTSRAANWATTDAVATTAATAGGGTPGAQNTGGTQPAPKLADIALSLSSFTVPSDLLLVAGGYNGSVTITVGPAATQ